MSTTAIPAEATAAPELVWLDPQALASHPANFRFELRNLDELAESITESGIVEPLVVLPIDDGYRILAGHRRAAASVMAELPLVPCWIRTDLADSTPDQLAAALAENVQRDGLTALEEAHAYAQLVAFPNWSIERIASAAGRTATEVRRGIDATKLPEHLQASAMAGHLTLEQAAALEAFADDASTYRRLLDHAGDRSFPHMLRQAQRDREVQRRLAEVRADLDAAGIEVVAKPAYQDVAVRLSDLYDDEGETLDETSHAKCPGHAAFLGSYSGAAIYICRDPKAWGHSTPPWYRHLTEAEAKALADEEEAEQARAADLQVAAEVRQGFLRERIATKGKVPAGTLRFVAEMMLDGNIASLRWDEDIAWYFGHDDPKAIDVDHVMATVVRKSSDARLPLVLLAAAGALAEANVAAHDSRWRYSPTATVRWFDFLVGLGFPLSDIEADLLDAARSSVADDESTDDEAGR